MNTPPLNAAVLTGGGSSASEGARFRQRMYHGTAVSLPASLPSTPVQAHVCMRVAVASHAGLSSGLLEPGAFLVSEAPPPPSPPSPLFSSTRANQSGGAPSDPSSTSTGRCLRGAARAAWCCAGGIMACACCVSGPTASATAAVGMSPSSTLRHFGEYAEASAAHAPVAASTSTQNLLKICGATIIPNYLTGAASSSAASLVARGPGMVAVLGAIAGARFRLGGNSLPALNFPFTGLTGARAGSKRDPRASSAAAGQSIGIAAKSSAFVTFTAGVFAGLAGDVPLHPLDTIKTRLQSQAGFSASGGFTNLWSGLSPVLLRGVPCSAIFFVTYEHLRETLDTHKMWTTSPLLVDAAAGAGANIVSCSVRVPCEVLKQRMQAQGFGLLSAAQEVVRTAGPRGLYAGSCASVVRELAFAVIQMPLYEELKRRSRCAGPSSSSNADKGNCRGLVGAACGGFAGATAGALTTPFDVVKTRTMLGQSGGERHSLLSALREVYAEGGPRRLFSGALPRTAYVGLSSALWLGAFEWSKAMFGHK